MSDAAGAAAGGVRVFMQVPEPREWRVPAGRRVIQVLQELGLKPDQVLVIHGDTLLTQDEVLAEGMEIEIRPPISGG